MTENTTGKIGTICYIMPQALINNGVNVIIPPEFTDNVNENNEITGELSIARSGIWKINNELYQFINFDSSVFEYKEKRGTKMTIGKTTYYIKDEDQILGIIEDEEC